MFFLTNSELFYICIRKPQKQETPWNFWSRLKIPGAHCDKILEVAARTTRALYESSHYIVAARKAAHSKRRRSSCHLS